MRGLRDLTLKTKLVLVILTVSATALAAFLALVLVLDARMQRQDLEASLATEAALVADYCISPLAFDDEQGLADVLSKSLGIPHIVVASVHSTDGVLIASERNDLAGPDDGSTGAGRLEKRQVISFEGATFGVLVLEATTDQIDQVMRRRTLAGLAIFLGVVVAATLFALFLQRLISRPILEIAEATRLVGADNDLSLRLKPRGNDEIAALSRGFNEMLDRIERHHESRLAAEAEQERLQVQLQQSQKMEAVGRLAGGVAHDFNNILMVIGSCCEFLLEGIDTRDPLHADALEIQKAGDRAATLTRQLLAFSRRQVIDPVAVDVNRAIAASEKMLRRLIGEDIDLIVIADRQLRPVLFDPGQLDQILMNLAVNARDAMIKGGRLMIETRALGPLDDAPDEVERPEDGHCVEIRVSDTGCGMDRQTLDHLFDPFFTTKSVGQGSGLGMSTVYGIVAQHSAAIRAESEPGSGTTIRIVIPATAQNVPRDEEWLGVDQGHGNESILLVEDEASVRRVAERILTAHGYEVIAADGPVEALRLGEDSARVFDLMLTDVVMPVMSGRECYEKLRRVRPGLKVLYMSGYTNESLENHGILVEGGQLIQKPFRSDDLAAKVQEVLSAPVSP